MLPYFVFDHLTIGPLTFYTWGFFVGLAFAVGYFLTLFQAKKKNIPAEKILILAWVVFFGAALGSRVGYLLQFPRDWLADVSLLWKFNQGGLMLWGGILGAILFGWLYIKFSPPHPPPLLTKERAGVRFWEVADLVAPAIALGIGIGRIGCFLINDHMGAPTSLPWGILWPDGISRHPVALYESLAGFGLFFIFWILQKKLLFEPLDKTRSELESRTNTNVMPAAEPASRLLDSRFRSPRWSFGEAGGNDTSGRIFLLFLASYAAIRFLLDFFRASDGILADPRWWGLTSSQWISVALIILGLYFFATRKIRKSIKVQHQ